MLKTIRLQYKGINSKENILRIERALNTEVWTHPESVSCGQGGVRRKLVSMTTRALDLRVANLEQKYPHSAAVEADIAWLPEADIDFDESALHDYLKNGSPEMRDLSMLHNSIIRYSIYSGWRHVKKGDKKVAEREFKRAIACVTESPGGATLQ